MSLDLIDTFEWVCSDLENWCLQPDADLWASNHDVNAKEPCVDSDPSSSELYVDAGHAKTTLNNATEHALRSPVCARSRNALTSKITAAAARKMSAGQREIVLAKRKQRNRESARRSRAKKEGAILDLLAQKSELERQIFVQNELLAQLIAENQALAKACAKLD
eukprot:CAMPEP_0185829436 /NCGR_PEP_ID=MMETSP1353-20130828/250_1 /TAXON_ID=1077150 /ORGANISM="Erythrolobus australicus, Strain CCMP3124" /LENGTH=163 /DNA_ID=CAMNT_0028527229 /DNA_START=27 /DNA_END=518 /DNA_ORIENTATION=+